MTADALSKINSPSPTEWRIPQETLHNLFSALGTPLVDMSATAENKVTPVCVLPYPDDRAWAVDALSISWDGLGLVYAFPQAPIMPKTLHKIKGLPRHDGDFHYLSAPVSTVAPAATTAQPLSSHTADQHGTVPIHSQHSPPSVPQRALPVGCSCMDLI